MEPRIIYESKDLIIVSKPAGLLVHSTPAILQQAQGKREKTLVDFILEKYPEIEGVGEDPARPGRPSHEATERHGIVHRLDRDTSGLLVVARTQRAYERLKELFQQRKIEKKYYALVWGDPSRKASDSQGSPQEDKGVIEKAIAAVAGKRVTVEKHSQKKFKKTRAAKTEWKAEKRFRKYTLLSVRPITGRTHQIRVHLHSIGHPVVCDKIYANKKECPESLGRMFLHAYSLHIPYDKGEVLEFDIPLAPELEAFLRNIRKQRTEV